MLHNPVVKKIVVTTKMMASLFPETGVTEKRRVPRVVVRPGPSLPQPSHSPPQISTRIIGGVNAQSGSVVSPFINNV